MTQSMTAFAAAADETPWGRLTLELRSLNHRYLEVGLRLPEEFRSMEPALRERVTGRLNRGKVDVGIRWKRSAGGEQVLSLNRPLAEQLAALSNEVRHLFTGSPHGSDVEWLRWPGLVQEPEPDLGSLADAVNALMDRGLDELQAMRGREGQRLAGLLLERLDQIEPLVEQVQAELPRIREKMGQRLNDKVTALTQKVDGERLEQELAVLLQRADVDEELDRLTAHVAAVRETLQLNKPVGRRLDFLMQELHREANTLGSKSVDTATTQVSVDLKVLIEQMREQVQNIE
ncbi:MAG: YicC/YloC family endoribonuclease [Xanthomonadales bacterium]|nr:YicC/YloC family endoribonuclease [Xanthomonadales bacterium]